MRYFEVFVFCSVFLLERFFFIVTRRFYFLSSFGRNGGSRCGFGLEG